jgi:putative glutamine amidotransferase
MAAARIGITTYGRNKQGDVRLPGMYVDAVRRAGGLPLLLPVGETRIAELLEPLDGLLLAGGGDICPALYQGDNHESVFETDQERDDCEILLARAALQQQLPIFGICRGIQVLNVALGGTLHEHLPDIVGEKVPHRLPPHVPTEHALRVAEDSQLASLIGQLDFIAASWHHQAIDRPADNLTPVAWAADGVIEAVEMATYPWLVAVQWHPELTAAKDPLQQRLFDQFVLASQAAA